MKYTPLAIAIAAISSQTFAMDGKVVDKNGEAIPDAVVEIVGSRTTLSVDSEGQFSFDETEVDEIHIKAPGFSHRVLHLHHTSIAAPVVITLVPTAIEQVDVVGIPIHASTIESAQPISVLSGEALRERQAATLGDSLANEVGVHTNFHGNVASTPIIRGLSGPRVQITQNSLDVSDVSRVGPDHAVASEVSTAEQVEVLRGPATLFFGSGAIGGVVNVVDKRVPTETETFGEFLVSHESVNNQKLASVNLNTGAGNVGFHLDGFVRDSDDYDVPEAPELEHPDEADRSVANSAEESSGYTLGTSYILDNGYIGISYGKLDREYGIPGHSHGGHEHEGEESEGEELVYADLEQERLQLISELNLDGELINTINTRIGYTDYTHAEIEEGVTGTLFANETTEAKVDVLHQPFADWKGGIVLHYKHSDVSAVGEEAFTPPSETNMLGLALVEERHFGEVLLQLGARIEQVTIDAENVLLPQLAAHSHGADEGDHDHDHEAEENITRVFDAEMEFTPVSLSAGLVWDFSPGYNIGVSFSRSERAPSASEVLSFGAHIGTRSYEIGALFDTHEDAGEVHFELSEKPLDLETSNNIDLTFRKHEGRVGIIVNAFYNQVDNYYFQAATGLYAESTHSHAHGDEGDTHEEDVHTDELPIYLFGSADAKLYGFEAQGIWKLNESLKATVFTDAVYAEIKEDGNHLPRTPPQRFGARFDYRFGEFSSYLSWTHYAEQEDVANLETPTEGYDWLDASITWNAPLNKADLAVFAKVENITDTQARVHTSFLKDIAPKPGRNITLGIRGAF